MTKFKNNMDFFQLTKLQKNIALITMICLLGVTLLGMYIAGPENQHQEIIRFHVIANSNSDEDQALKLMVRDGILEEHGPQLEGLLLGDANDSESNIYDKKEIVSARSYILRNMNNINALAEKIIRKQGFDYTSKSKLGVTYIPAKSYDDIYFPAGNYEALNIVIGEGKGDNWWCVLFPPLCLIDGNLNMNDKDGPKQGKKFYKNNISKSKSKTKQAIILKSKIKEIIGK